MLKQMTSPEMLKKHQYFSLQRRCMFLKENYGCAVSPMHLLRAFKKLGLSYSRPQTVYLSYLKKRDQVQHERQQFARRLKELIDNNEPIIYLDESSFNTWHRASKVWQFGDSPVEIAVNPKRAAITVYGAIGNALTAPVFMTGSSTNQKDYFKFLQLLSENIKEEV